MKVILFLYISTIIISCQATKEIKGGFGVTARLVNEAQFEIDSITDANSRTVNIYKDENTTYLAYHHISSNSISIFDLKSQKMVSKITFEKEGPNGLGEGITAMYFHNFDSIFLLASLAQKIYLLDSSGVIKNNFNVANDYSYIDFGTVSPAFIRKGQLYLSSYPNPMKKASSKDVAMVRLDLITKKIEKVIFFSKEYNRGWWGRHTYLNSSTTFNKKLDLMITSFPNDHSIYTVDNENNVSKYTVASERISALKPISKEVTDDDLQMFAHAAKYGNYSGIFYDQWNNIYYRVAYTPVHNYRSLEDLGKSISLIIMNNDFVKIGEFRLPDNTYIMGSSFVSPYGFYLFNKNKYIQDDNFLFYDIFAIHSIKNDSINIEDNLTQYLNDINLSNELPENSIQIIIPTSGCMGCINPAIKFLKEHVGDEAFQFTVTEIIDKKQLKNWLGKDIFSSKMLKLDYENIWRRHKLNSVYPLVIVIKNKKVSSFYYVNPLKKEIWNELAKK